LRLADEFPESNDKIGFESLNGRPRRSNTANYRQGKEAFRVNPKRPFIDFVGLWRSDENLIVRPKHIIRTDGRGYLSGSRVCGRLPRRRLLTDYSHSSDAQKGAH
jgi:hypothetical protein